MHYTEYNDIIEVTAHIRKDKMVTDKIKQAMERYPDLNDIVELAAHYDEGTPLHRICAYVANLTADIIDAVPEQTDGTFDE